MTEAPPAGPDNLRIREMSIDDFPAVFHIGEQVFTAESFQNLYRTWDEYGLFKEIKHRMKEQGVRMMLIDTSADNHPAVRFFKKQGFGDIREHVYMSLNLSRKSRKKPVKKP